MKWIWTALLVLVLMTMPAIAAPAAVDPGWKALGESTWIAEGASKNPEHIVYVFTDTECPYCHKLWLAMRPYLADGTRVQVRNIPVAVISEDSEPRAQAILMQKDPAAAFAKHEAAFKSGGIAKATTLSPDISAKLEKNQALMSEFGLRGTPAILYLDADGKMRGAQGSPSPAALAAIMGAPAKP
jgi:thiol:disulfide interchange protein DsbG